MAPRPLPVLFACPGCPEYGDTANGVAAVLDARGFARAARVAAGDLAARAPHGVPLYVVEGCAKRCAGQWLARQGARAQRQFILAAPGDSPEQIAERIMEGWT